MVRKEIDLIAMAGFGTVLAPSFFNIFSRTVLNIHPSLLPAFKGKTAVADALAFGVKWTGSTIHIANPKLDEGRIIDQVPVPVLRGDTVDRLWERIKGAERPLYSDVIGRILSGELVLQ